MKRRILDMMMKACCMAVAVFCTCSCSDGLDIQQEYPFEVISLPVAGKIAAGETAEIRLEIRPEGHFDGTVYTLRYFQPDGKGTLQMSDGTVLRPNDRYFLNELEFRLYYTSASPDEAQSIDLYFEDNWGNMKQLSYDFNNDTPSRQEETEKFTDTEGGANG